MFYDLPQPVVSNIHFCIIVGYEQAWKSLILSVIMGYNPAGLSPRLFLMAYVLFSVLTGDDSWDLITCYCGKPFAGRPMIECNQCGVWVHLSCAKIKKSNVPDIFYCHKCRDCRRSGHKKDP